MQTQPCRFGPFVYDPDRQVLVRDGAPVPLGHKALVLLGVLLAAKGRAVSKEALLDAVWPGQHVEENNLAVQIAALRRVLGKAQDWIVTLPRTGYRFANPAVPLPPEPPADAPVRPSVAVLPFVNLSADPGQEYLSDGITGDIITELSRWRLLSVRSGSASFRYRGMGADLKQIAADLDVRYVVEGSVRRMDQTIRISAQLIDAESGNHVWAEKYDRAADEIFAVQDQVVRTIVSTLVGRIYVSSVERASRKPPSSLAAYECVLQGIALPWDDPAGASEATRLFEQAIRLDPGYGHAYSLLSNMRVRQWSNAFSDDMTAVHEAVALGIKAVQLDASESTNHCLLGQAHLKLGAYDLALQCSRRALEINPSNQWNNADMGFVLVYCGQAGAALEWFARAREIDPHFGPGWYWTIKGMALMILGRHEEARAAFETLNTRDYWQAAHVAGCYARLEQTDRARILAAECLQKRPDFSIARRMAKELFRNPADADCLAGGMVLAGLPE